jgi:hypothetical protein
MPGSALILTSLTTPASKPFRLWAGGSDILKGSSGQGVPIDSISIVDAGWNTPGTMTFTYEDPAKAYALPAGCVMSFWDYTKNAAIWGGFLTNRTRIPDFGQQGISVQCSAIDWSAQLDWNLIDRTITYPAGLTDAAIFQGLLGEFGKGLNPASPFITVTNSSMPTMTFGDQTLRSGLEQVCAAAQDTVGLGTERRYYVDVNQLTHYYALETFTAPYRVTDSWNGL